MATYRGTDTGATGDRGIAFEETGKLIAASKVEGTSVYNRRGESLGSIYDMMIDKRSGRVAYAIMSFGGFLGLGQDYHPLPWNLLTYDPGMGGYVVDLDKDRLMGAPRFSQSDRPNWTDPAFTHGIDDYYGVPPYTL
jgi:sporulation protein YlmC with PRC-barrel domain